MPTDIDFFRSWQIRQGLLLRLPVTRTQTSHGNLGLKLPCQRSRRFRWSLPQRFLATRHHPVQLRRPVQVGLAQGARTTMWAKKEVYLHAPCVELHRHLHSPWCFQLRQRWSRVHQRLGNCNRAHLRLHKGRSLRRSLQVTRTRVAGQVANQGRR